MCGFICLDKAQENEMFIFYKFPNICGGVSLIIAPGANTFRCLQMCLEESKLIGLLRISIISLIEMMLVVIIFQPIQSKRLVEIKSC